MKIFFLFILATGVCLSQIPAVAHSHSCQKYFSVYEEEEAMWKIHDSLFLRQHELEQQNARTAKGFRISRTAQIQIQEQFEDLLKAREFLFEGSQDTQELHFSKFQLHGGPFEYLNLEVILRESISKFYKYNLLNILFSSVDVNFRLPHRYSNTYREYTILTALLMNEAKGQEDTHPKTPGHIMDIDGYVFAVSTPISSKLEEVFPRSLEINFIDTHTLQLVGTTPEQKYQMTFVKNEQGQITELFMRLWIYNYSGKISQDYSVRFLK